MHTAVAASQHTAWRPSVIGPPLSVPAPAWAPDLRTEEEAIAWLGTERGNLHACVGHAAAHARVVHAVRIPAAVSGFLLTEGHWTEAVTLGQIALAAARTASDLQGQAWTLNQLGTVQELTGEYPAAAASQAQALQLFRDLGDRHGQSRASINLGEILFLSSAYREARGYFAQALSITRDINTPVEEAQALEGIGRCHIVEGRPNQGAAHIRQALAIYRRLGAPEAQRAETTLLN